MHDLNQTNFETSEVVLSDDEFNKVALFRLVKAAVMVWAVIGQLINSSSMTSEAQIDALLFSDEAKHRGPSTVFNVGTPRRDAVQGEKNSLLSLMIEFAHGKCLDEHCNYNSMKYPPMCGEGTAAVPDLGEIYNIISTKRSSFDSVVVMLTGGTILDDSEEREKVLIDI